MISIILFYSISSLLLDDFIVWSKDCFLRWNDFQAESNPAAFEDAHSTIRFRHTWTLNSDKVENKIVFFIENLHLSVEFHPVLSWYRQGENNDTLLRHEQGHFDLGELVKNENLENLQNKFYGKQFPTRGQNEEQRKQFAKEDSGKMISKDVKALDKILSQRRKQYDDDTCFGQNIDAQLKYNLLFDKLRV